MRGRRLVLGYDGGCAACSALAQRIEEAVGDELEVRSLHEPQMVRWREEALGKEAPWAPTLIEVSGDKARAWTGVRMGAALARRLGPAATWRVMRVLGEKGDSPSREPGLRGSLLSRGQFVKGLSGAIAAVTVFSSTKVMAVSLATESDTEEHWIVGLRFKSFRKLSTKEAAEAWAWAFRGQNLRQLIAVKEVKNEPNAKSLFRNIASGHIDVSDTSSYVVGVRHELEGGNSLLALAYSVKDLVVVSYLLLKNESIEKQTSLALVRTGETHARILAAVEDNTVKIAARSANVIPARQTKRCRNSDCPYCYSCGCTSLDVRCAFGCCGLCIPTCAANAYACIACLAAYCPACLLINRCCNRRGCIYVCSTTT
ncbi:MAG: hypothetical protein IRY88_17085 [Rubrobacteraceae bacterium]|nr:hypothetical protein [Rubrobacteraceae bacterium]